MNGNVTALSGDARSPHLLCSRPEHAFAGHDVRIGAVEARGLVGAVEVHEQLPLRRLLRDALVVVDHPLVFALHEVDLDALHAPLLELVERRRPSAGRASSR